MDVHLIFLRISKRTFSPVKLLVTHPLQIKSFNKKLVRYSLHTLQNIVRLKYKIKTTKENL
jgi:hypothetical protein